MKLSSRAHLLNESKKELTSIRRKLREAQVADEKLNALINEFAELSEEMDRAQAYLKQLKTRFSEINNTLVPVMEELQDLKQNAIQTDKYLLTIKRAGYDRWDSSYKTAFELALTKVNKKIASILQETLESTKTVTRVAPSLAVQKIKEDGFFANTMAKIKTLFGALVSKIRGAKKDMTDLNALIKKAK